MIIKFLAVANHKIYKDKYVPLKHFNNVKDSISENFVYLDSRIEKNEATGAYEVMTTIDGKEYTIGCLADKKSLKGKPCKSVDEYESLLKDFDEETEQRVRLCITSDSATGIILEVEFLGETKQEKKTSELMKGGNIKNAEDLKKFLSELRLSEVAASKLLDYIKNNNNKDTVRIPGRTTFENYDNVMESMCYGIVSGANIMLEGPMAAGKNTCIETLAYNFNREIFEIQVNAYIDNDALLGTRTVKAKESADEREKINEEALKLMDYLFTKGPESKELIEGIKNGSKEEQVDIISSASTGSNIDFAYLIDAIKNDQTEISFQPSALIRAMEKGAWVVVDEFNTGAAAIMAVLNSVLDNRRRIDVPGYGRVIAQEGFRFFATMNPDYEGTSALNPATSSRFLHIEFKAADKITPIILSREPETTRDFLKSAESLYSKIKAGIEKGDFEAESMNIRGFIEASKLNLLGMSVSQSLNLGVVNSILSEDDKKGLKDFIDISI